MPISETRSQIILAGIHELLDLDRTLTFREVGLLRERTRELAEEYRIAIEQNLTIEKTIHILTK